MASKSALRLPIANGFQLPTRRNLSSFAPATRTLPKSRIVPRQSSRTPLPKTFHRSYADSAPVKKRRAGFFRWTWRLTYLSALGGLGYLGYLIYDLRTPDEQYEPDPKKKTLVILGLCIPHTSGAID